MAQVELNYVLVDNGINHELQRCRQLVSFPRREDVAKVNSLESYTLLEHIFRNPLTCIHTKGISTQFYRFAPLKIVPFLKLTKHFLQLFVRIIEELSLRWYHEIERFSGLLCNLFHDFMVFLFHDLVVLLFA